MPGSSKVKTLYIQGVRQSDDDPFLDEIGRVMTYHKNWKTSGLGGRGNYMRFDTNLIETSEGTVRRPYLCQICLN